MNYLLPVKKLPATDRTSIWLRLKDIPKLMICLPRQIKALAYFLILTGARISEALAVKAVHRLGQADHPHPERQAPPQDTEQSQEVQDDPESGYLFHKGVMKANLGHLIPKEVAEGGGHAHVIPHDCRGSMVNHALLAGRNQSSSTRRRARPRPPATGSVIAVIELSELNADAWKDIMVSKSKAAPKRTKNWTEFNFLPARRFGQVLKNTDEHCGILIFGRVRERLKRTVSKTVRG